MRPKKLEISARKKHSRVLDASVFFDFDASLISTSSLGKKFLEIFVMK